MDSSKLAGTRDTSRRKLRVYLIHKQTGKVSSVCCYHEYELMLAIVNRNPEFSYVSNDAEILVKVTPLPPATGETA